MRAKIGQNYPNLGYPPSRRFSTEAANLGRWARPGTRGALHPAHDLDHDNSLAAFPVIPTCRPTRHDGTRLVGGQRRA